MLGRDEDNSYLTLNGLAEDPLKDIHSHMVTYRVAIGPSKAAKCSPYRLSRLNRNWHPITPGLSS